MELIFYLVGYYFVIVYKTKEGKGVRLMNARIEKRLLPALKERDKILQAGQKSKDELIALQNLIQFTAKQIKNSKTHELEKALFTIIQEEAQLFRNTEGDQETHQKIEFKRNIIEHALTLRKKDYNNKKYMTPVERNYAEAPIFASTLPTSKTLIELKQENGVILERRTAYRQISYRSQHMLSTYDFKVFSGLQRLWELKGKNQEFTFHVNELIEIIEGENNGGTQSLIFDSLHKLFTTDIFFEDYYDPELKIKMDTEWHHLINNVRFVHEESEQNRISHIEISFNKYLHKGLSSGNYVRINMSLYQDLSSATSKLLYPIIASLITERREFEIDELINVLGLNRITRKEALKKIRAALDNFVEAGIIERYIAMQAPDGRSYKSYILEPSKTFLDGIEGGLVVPPGQTI